jgi:hypothetical protein
MVLEAAGVEQLGDDAGHGRAGQPDLGQLGAGHRTAPPQRVHHATAVGVALCGARIHARPAGS